MIERDGNTIRAVAWSEVFPWLSIIRTFRLAIAVRALVLGAAAILITAACWGLMGLMFYPGESDVPLWLGRFTANPWAAVTEAVPNQPVLLSYDGGWGQSPGSLVAQPESADAVTVPWQLMTLPALEGLSSQPHKDLSFSAMVCVLLCGLLSVAVWALFGAAICRMAAVQLATGEQVGCVAAMRYACQKWPSYFFAPLFPLGGVLLAAIPVVVLGLIMYIGLPWLGAILWPLVLVAGLLMTLLLAGVLFGWPLMWGTISAEGTDCFDALSRSYAYVFQRPLHYLFYVVVASVIGWLGWLVVRDFAAGVVWMGYWSAGWGTGSGQIDAILRGDKGFSPCVIRFCAGCVKLLAVGYLYSYLWTAAAAIYYLLRRDVDATEMDEVYLDADQNEQTFGLPEVATDQAGAPVIKDDVADKAE